MNKFNYLLFTILLFIQSFSVSYAAEVNQVLSGTASSSSDGITTVALGTTIDTSKSFLIFNTRSNSNRPPGSMVSGRISSSTELEFDRNTNESSTINIQWYVVEFSSGVFVQRGSVTQSTTTVDVTLPSAVSSLNQSYVTWSKTPKNSDTTFSADDPIIGELTSTSNLQFRADLANGDHTIWWQVIEYTNASEINVQSGSIDPTSINSKNINQAISAIDTSKAFILVGYTVNGNGSDLRESTLHAHFSSTTNIHFHAKGKFKDGVIEEIFWQVIELKDSTVVQGGEDSINNGSSIKNVTISTVTTANSIAFASIQAVAGQSLGQSEYGGGDILGAASATLSFTNSTTLTLTRKNTNNKSKFGWFAVDYSSATGSDPVIYHAMDETTWDGTANEVNDDSGNSAHGTATNGAITDNSSPAIAGATGTCRYGTFDGTDDYISNSNLSTLLGTASISFWMRTTQIGNNTVWLAPGITGIEEFGGSDDVFWGWIDASGNLGFTVLSNDTDVKSTLPINDGVFHHIVMTRDSVTGDIELYVDGILNDSATKSTGTIGNSFSRIGSIEDTGGMHTYFDGDLDEVKIFSQVLSAADVTILMAETHACAVSATIDHFTFSIANNPSSTCVADPITITAIDSDGATMTGYDGTINITTSTNHGNWSVNDAINSTTPVSDTNDDGAVSYSFSSSDSGDIILDLDNTHADTLTITAVDDSDPTTSSTSSSVTFSRNTFIIGINEPTLDSDLTYTPLIGRPHNITVLMFTDIFTFCGVNTAYDGNMTIKNWVTRQTNDPGDDTPFLDGSAFNMADNEAAALSQSISFTEGVANITVNSDDISRVSLHIKDESGSFATADIEGSYYTLAFRPFGLAITDITSGAVTNPESSANPDFLGGGVFADAGDNFSVTVSAVPWVSSADDDTFGLNLPNDGIIDDDVEYRDIVSTIDNFAWDTDLQKLSTGFTPTSGQGGAVGNLLQSGVAYTGPILQADFSSGTAGAATVSNLQYTEVGSFTINASISSIIATDGFLNSGIALESDDIIVGRFKPSYFEVSNVTNGELDSAYSNFTYTGQDFTYLTEPTFEVRAYNALMGQTLNYTGVYSNLTDSSWTTTTTEDFTQYGADEFVVLPDMPTKMQLTYTRLATSVIESPNATFTYTLGNDLFNYTKDSNSLIAPFVPDLNLEIDSINDGVGEVNTTFVTPVAINPGTSSGDEIRFGRIRIKNAHGSELLTLNVPFLAQHFDGSNFITNTADNTTSFETADLTLTPDYEVVGTLSTENIANDPLLTGEAGLSFCPPGNPACTAASGNTATITIDLDLSSAGYDFLRYDWDSDGTHDDDPSATATFGIYGGNEKHIYIRELY